MSKPVYARWWQSSALWHTFSMHSSFGLEDQDYVGEPGEHLLAFPHFEFSDTALIPFFWAYNIGRFFSLLNRE